MVNNANILSFTLGSISVTRLPKLLTVAYISKSNTSSFTVYNSLHV